MPSKQKLELETVSDELYEHIKDLSSLQQLALKWRLEWLASAHSFQLVPPGEWWSTWLLLGGRGCGKALIIDTSIPTPDGWKTMGTLREGDLVYNECGDICKVLIAHEPYTPKKLYRVHFSDGNHLDADADHLWTVWTRPDRKQYLKHHKTNLFPRFWASYSYPIYQARSNGDKRVILGYANVKPRTTEELIEILREKTKRQDLNLCIPCALPIYGETKELPIDPWLLGYWLAKSYWHNTPKHIEKFMRNYDPLAVKHFIKQALKLDLLKTKRIPDIYLRASNEQRLKLLQGFCDASAFAEPQRACFETNNQPLSEQVYELVCSLGERPTITTRIGQCGGKFYKTVYRITWRWTIHPPFTILHKLKKSPPVRSQGLRMRHRMITAIEEIEPTTVRCITVNSPSGLYLAGRGMIPTHNTKCAANNVGWWAWDQPGTRGLVMAPTANDIRFTCFEGDSGLLNTIPSELIAKYNKSTFELELKNGSHLRGISADSYERLRGPQFHYAWTDELAAFEYLQEAWDMMQFGLRLGKNPRVIATTTPKPKELIWQLIKREGKDVAVDRATSYANLANLAPTFKAQITQYEGTKLGRQEIHAEIIDPFEAGVIKKPWIKLWPYNKPLPAFDFVLYSLDTAFTEKTVPTKEERKRGTYEDRDPTACTVWGLFNNAETKRPEIILLDCWNDYYGLPDLIEQVKKDRRIAYGANPAKAYVQAKVKPKEEQSLVGGRLADLILIEEKGSGISLRQMLSREGINTYPYNPGQADKLSRLHAVSHFFYHGIIWFPESETNRGHFKSWTDECVKQLCSYAGEGSIKHEDLVDSTTQALIYFADKQWLSMTVIKPESGVIVKRKPSFNPYSQ